MQPAAKTWQLKNGPFELYDSSGSNGTRGAGNIVILPGSANPPCG
jgi:hypothetical protein